MSSWQPIEFASAPKNRRVDVLAVPASQCLDEAAPRTLFPNCRWHPPEQRQPYGSHTGQGFHAGRWEGLPEGFIAKSWRDCAV